MPTWRFSVSISALRWSSELDAGLEQLLECLGKVGEPDVRVLGVDLDVLAENGVDDQRDVSRQHHQIARLVLVLHRIGLGVDVPLLAEEQREEGVVEAIRVA